MNSILRALLARWPLVTVSTIACLLGGLWVTTTSTPRYQGHARVVLDYIRPDPVTGQVVSADWIDTYLESQVQLLLQPRVVLPAAEMLGWMDDPTVLANYSERPEADTRDYASWVAHIMATRIRARMVEGSNIMEISYYGDSEELARTTAEALRATFVEATAWTRQEASREGAERIQEKLEALRDEITKLEALQTSLERETGVVLGAGGREESSVRLSQLVKQREASLFLESAPPSIAKAALQRLEDDIARASMTLGANNPTLRQMEIQREQLRAQVAAEATTAEVSQATVRARDQAAAAYFEDLKARVLSTREPALRLRLLQDQIDGRREEFKRLTETLVSLRSAQTTTISSVSPTGESYSEPRPVFPNPLLILGGSGAIGFMLGGGLACLSELMGRRIRTRGHLETAAGVAVLMELPNLRKKAPWRLRQRRALKRPVGESVAVPAVAA